MNPIDTNECRKMMTDDERKRLRELCDAATPGPWKSPDIGIYESPDDDDDLAFARGPMSNRTKFADSGAWRKQAEADSRFCAAAHTAVPELLDEIERLRFYETTSAADAIRMLNEARAALVEACRLLEGTVDELAALETDPSMLDGHRARIAELRKVGGK